MIVLVSRDSFSACSRSSCRVRPQSQCVACLSYAFHTVNLCIRYSDLNVNYRIVRAFVLVTKPKWTKDSFSHSLFCFPHSVVIIFSRLQPGVNFPNAYMGTASALPVGGHWGTHVKTLCYFLAILCRCRNVKWPPSSPHVRAIPVQIHCIRYQRTGKRKRPSGNGKSLLCS